MSNKSDSETIERTSKAAHRSLTEATAGDRSMTAAAERLVEAALADNVPLTGRDGVLTGFVGRVLETALERELTAHLGYERHSPKGHGSGNSRNGHYAKSVVTDIGPVDLRVPRDRAGTFEPMVVPVGQRRVGGIDDLVISLYAKGLTSGDIVAHLDETYEMSMDRSMVSRITKTVAEDMTLWQSRPLDVIYPVLLVDGIRIKIRDGSVSNRVVYVVMGINLEGERDILGLWVGPTGGESPKVLAVGVHRTEEPWRG